MKKTILRSIITTALLAVMFTVMPAFSVRAEAAAKKPAAVKKIETVKVTKNSIQIKYSKAKGAKGYQVNVYDGKKKVKGMKVAKTTCTVKGLEPDIQYTVRVFGYNGKANGKKASAKIYTADKNGIVGIGKSTNTGKGLEKEYKAWRDFVIKQAKKDYKTSPKPDFLLSVASEANIILSRRCTKAVTNYKGNPNKYEKKKVYETYKKGKGTNLELYQLLLDIVNTSGKIECEILEEDNMMKMANWTDGWKLRIIPGVTGFSKCRKK